MYVKPQNYRFPAGGVRLPQNYSGNAFGTAQSNSADENVDIQEQVEEAQPDTSPTEEITASAEPAAKRAGLLKESGFHLRLGSLLGGKFGTEEFLILAMILLLADGDDNDELILFLILLFFIK